MNTSELAELFLTFLYDRAEAEGYGKWFSLNEIATKLGVYDNKKIYNAVNILKSRELIEVSNEVSMEVKARISGEGCFFVERGGETGIITKYRKNPEAFIININKSTNFYGDVSKSNISPNSSNVTQIISVNNNIHDIISQMVNALHMDNSISISVREDALKDIETINIQLSKNTKDKNILKSTLDQLSKIAPIGSFVTQLSSLIF